MKTTRTKREGRIGLGGLTVATLPKGTRACRVCGTPLKTNKVRPICKVCAGK